MGMARAVVFSGRKEKTGSGMTKAKLTKNKSGRIVSRKASAASKKSWAASGAKKWMDACKQARKQLNVKGFCAVVASFFVRSSTSDKLLSRQGSCCLFVCRVAPAS